MCPRPVPLHTLATTVWCDLAVEVTSVEALLPPCVLHCACSVPPLLCLWAPCLGLPEFAFAVLVPT